MMNISFAMNSSDYYKHIINTYIILPFYGPIYLQGCIGCILTVTYLLVYRKHLLQGPHFWILLICIADFFNISFNGFRTLLSTYKDAYILVSSNSTTITHCRIQRILNVMADTLPAYFLLGLSVERAVVIVFLGISSHQKNRIQRCRYWATAAILVYSSVWAYICMYPVYWQYNKKYFNKCMYHQSMIFIVIAETIVNRFLVSVVNIVSSILLLHRIYVSATFRNDASLSINQPSTPSRFRSISVMDDSLDDNSLAPPPRNRNRAGSGNLLSPKHTNDQIDSTPLHRSGTAKSFNPSAMSFNRTLQRTKRLAITLLIINILYIFLTLPFWIYTTCVYASVHLLHLHLQPFLWLTSYVNNCLNWLVFLHSDRKFQTWISQLFCNRLNLGRRLNRRGTGEKSTRRLEGRPKSTM